MATHSCSFLGNPMAEEPGGLQAMGSQGLDTLGNETTTSYKHCTLK